MPTQKINGTATPMGTYTIGDCVRLFSQASGFHYPTVDINCWYIVQDTCQSPSGHNLIVVIGNDGVECECHEKAFFMESNRNRDIGLGDMVAVDVRLMAPQGMTKSIPYEVQDIDSSCIHQSGLTGTIELINDVGNLVEYPSGWFTIIGLNPFNPVHGISAPQVVAVNGVPVAPPVSALVSQRCITVVGGLTQDKEYKPTNSDPVLDMIEVVNDYKLHHWYPQMYFVDWIDADNYAEDRGYHKGDEGPDPVGMPRYTPYLWF